MKAALARAAMPVLRRIDPERAHELALRALRSGLAPAPGPITSPHLRTRIAGLDLPNPLGLAAGFDKDGDAIAPLLAAGFGFIEVGGTTPRPQPGNPRPRLFRLSEDGAVINRFGFNSAGADAMAERLAKTRRGIVGLNLGSNKDTTDRAADYVKVLQVCGPHADFVTVNVSSPNTAGLRGLQTADALAPLLDRVLEARAQLRPFLPVFLKIAPDLDAPALDAVAATATAKGIDAVIATNTTTAREALHSQHAGEAGGLSGRPLFAPSTAVLAALSDRLDGRVPLIGVGGIASAEDAIAKFEAGATALQLYTALAYRGLDLVSEILKGIEAYRAARSTAG